MGFSNPLILTIFTHIFNQAIKKIVEMKYVGIVRAYSLF